MSIRSLVPWGGLVVLLLAVAAWWPGESRLPLPQPPQPMAHPAAARPAPEAGSAVTPMVVLTAPLSSARIEKSTAELLEAIAEAFRSPRREVRDFALETLLAALVAQDAPAAARAVIDIENEDLRQETLDRLARLWAVHDPTAALRWADALVFADEREVALTGVCMQTGTKSVSEAVETLSTHVPGDRPLAALEDLTQRWAEADFVKARSWALANDEGPRRENLLARVAFVQARTDPSAAATLIVAELPPGEARDEAVISVLHQWAQRDPHNAARWVASFEPGPLRERAVRELEVASRLEPPAGLTASDAPRLPGSK